MATQLAFKTGVKLNRWYLRPECILIWDALLHTAPKLYGDCVMITSADDSHNVHMGGSFHGLGAVDVRYAFGPEDEPRLGSILCDDPQDGELGAGNWVDRLRKALGQGYDVILESEQKHIHIEPDNRSK